MPRPSTEKQLLLFENLTVSAPIKKDRSQEKAIVINIYVCFLFFSHKSSIDSQSIYPITGNQIITNHIIHVISNKLEKLNTSCIGEARSPKWNMSELIIAQKSHLFTRKSKGVFLPDQRARVI